MYDKKPIDKHFLKGVVVVMNLIRADPKYNNLTICNFNKERKRFKQ